MRAEILSIGSDNSLHFLYVQLTPRHIEYGPIRCRRDRKRGIRRRTSVSAARRPAKGELYDDRTGRLLAHGVSNLSFSAGFRTNRPDGDMGARLRVTTSRAGNGPSQTGFKCPNAL